MISKQMSWVLALSTLATVAAGCGASKEGAKSEEVPPVLALTGVSPYDVKANHDGNVTLSGAGFLEAGLEVTVDGGSLSSAFPGAQMTVLDEWTIEIDFSGALVEQGDRSVKVKTLAAESEPVALHVRPVLATLEHVRTLPGYFNRTAGFLDIWAMPKDELAAFIGPGHELAGLSGLGDANFRWENVRATRLSDMTQSLPDISGVADVKFEPVGTSNPLSIAITIDQSGSMIGLGVNPVPSDPNDERVNQAQAFVARMGALDQASIIRFQGQAGAVFTVQDFTSDKTVLTNALDTLRTTEGGNTPLYDSMIKSVADLAAQPATRTKALIVLTDGRDTTSAQTSAQAITAARNANIPVFAIGLGNPNDAASLDRSDLENIAAQTGGRVFFAEDPTALAGIFDELTAILADSYKLEAAISFNPALPAAGGYKIEGDIVADIDGEEIKIPMTPFNISVLN